MDLQRISLLLKRNGNISKHIGNALQCIFNALKMQCKEKTLQHNFCSACFSHRVTIFLSFFGFVLDLLPFIRLKATHYPRQNLFWGLSSAFYCTGSPSLCWPLASSGSNGILTWFS